MSSYNSCVTSLRLTNKIPMAQIKEVAAQYESEGMTADAALERAVRDQLELAKMEERRIVSAVRSAYEAGGGKAAPVKAKAKAAKAAEPKPGAVDNTPAPTAQFAGNKIFTADAVEKARARMKAKLGTLNSGIDPELMMDGITIAGAYIESGVRSFGAFAKAMIGDLGEGVRPYLRSFYEGARHYPGLDTAGMSTAVEIDAMEDRGTAPHTQESTVKNEAIGEAVKVKAKAPKAPADPVLRGDWGVDHIDGYAPIEGGKNEQGDYGMAGGLKDAFLKDAKNYLTKVAQYLEGMGYSARADRKGKAVSVSEAGPAVAGDVYLNMQNDELGHGIQIQVGASAMRGMTPTSRSGLSVMMRATNDKGRGDFMNNWMPVDLPASQLAEKAADMVHRVAMRNSVAKSATVVNTETTPAAPAQQEQDNDSTTQESSPSVDPAMAQGQRPAGSEGVARGVEQPRAGSGRSDDRSIRAEGGRDSGTDDAGQDLGNRAGADRVSDAAPGSVAGSGKRVSADHIPAVGGLTREGSWFDTAKRNVDLIELALKIEGENRPATAAEQAQLAKYVGFGASAIRNKLFPIPSAYAKQAEPNRLIWPNMIHEASWRALAERMEALPAAWQRSVLQSSQYAHYTSEGIIRSVWSGMQRLGFTGGKVFEPGMGIGSFSMLMPDAVRKTSRYTGVEFDGPTALIARLLSPEQNMLHDDFIKRKFPKDFFDVAIGNPPFSQTQIFGDPDYEKHGFMLHDFFFAKSIDRVRPGGLLAFVTSKGTMDKQTDKARKYLAARADLVGAIRLPSTAFEDNAGTSVVTDVIFLRKRKDGEAPGGAAWSKVATVDTKDGPVVINEYFAANPDMVLGQNRISGGTDDMGRRINSNGRGGEKYTVVSYDSTPAELDAKFAAAVERLPQNVYSVLDQSPASVKRETAKVDFDPSVKREGVVYVSKGGELMRVENGVGVPLSQGMKMQKADEAWFKGYVGLRDLVNDARLAQATDGKWEAALKKLNKAYDAFRAEHGPINDFRVQVRKSTDEDGNPVEVESRVFKNRRRLREDYDSSILTQLETITEGGEIVKSPFLNGRTIGAPVTRDVQTIGDALAVSLDELGKLDLDDVGRRIGLNREEAINALDKQVYKTPAGEWQLADEYLSGDVVSKLEEAEQAARLDASLRRNVEALKAAQPEKLGPSQISAKLGSSWVPEAHVNAFAAEIGAGAVTFDPKTETWQVDGGNLRSQRRAGAEYGTAARSPSELLEAALNSRSVKITNKIEGKTVTDQEATTAANEMLKKIKDKFKGWVWTDSERATELVESYNRRFNNIAPRRFDGSHLTLPGVSMRYKLHPHQKTAIARVIQTGDTYLAHAVGSGKTIEMIAAGMEQKRLGLIKKPMYVVPNHMLEQFANEFMELYPLANIMVADDENFSAERRKAFIANATMNNPDAVIITHDAFQRIGVKEESVAPIRDEILADLEIELSETAKDNGARVRRGQLEQQIEAVTQRFDRIISAGGKDSTLKFEDIGVDFIFADEAHVFRKLDFHTSQQIKGIDPNGSKRALDMYVKTRWLQSQRPGRAMVFASGTPVTNTMGELYTIMRFFAPEEMNRAGISTFDAWARQFGEVAPALEPNAAGKYELIERFAKFDNVPELMSRVRQFMDVLTSEHLGALVKRPDLIGGKPNLNIVESGEALQDYMKTELGPRIERSKAWKPSQSEPNNPDPIVSIITDGRFAAIDPRFFGGEVGTEGSIITVMGDKVAAAYHAGKDNVYLDKNGKPEPIKGSTQIVFYNMGFGEQSQKNRGFNSRAAFTKRLTDGGIPRDQIAWFDDADTDAKKEAVFKDMRSGKLRVLIGSAKKMGTGVNVQKRLAVLHYQDPPWFPADVEQPHGRIIRQGNQNKEVAIEWYTTKGTYQSTMWQMVGRKQRFIDQAFSGDKTLRSMDDMGEASLFEQAAAVASGDPRAIQLAGLKQDVERFERLQAAHASEQISVRSALRSAEWQVENAGTRIRSLSEAFKVIGERYYSFTTAKVGKAMFEKVGEFGQAVKDAFNQMAADAVMGKPPREQQIGTLGDNLPLTVDAEFGKDNKPSGELTLYVNVGNMPLTVATGPAMGADVDAVGLGRRIVNQVNSISSDLTRAKSDLASGETDLVRLRKKQGAPFEYQQEMAEKYGELKRLEAELKAEGEAKPEAAPIVIAEDGTMDDDELRASTAHAFAERRTRTIEVDGVRRPITNSRGQLVAHDFAGQQAFWKWFGDSKAVDPMGNPKVMYHGTTRLAINGYKKAGEREQIDAFRADDQGGSGAIYLTDRPDYADQYTNSRNPHNGGQIYAVYVKADRPFEFYNESHMKQLRGILTERGQFGAEGFRDGRANDYVSESEWRHLENGSFGVLERPLVRDAIQAAGFDSYYVREQDGGWDNAADAPVEVMTLAVFSPEQIKSATGNSGAFDPENPSIVAKKGDNQPAGAMDTAIAGMVQEGTTVDKVLAKIAAESKNADYRALAAALQAVKLKTGLLFERARGTYTGGVDAGMATAAYRASTDTAYLHQVEGAEQNLLHELVHAATLKALAKGGLAATQIRALWRHVRALPNFAEEYGITNEEEFIAEAYTSPRFRQMLAATPAPGVKLSLWEKLVGIVKILLGKPAVSDSVLDRVMQAGPALMVENQRGAAPGDVRAAGGELSAAFKRWFGDSKVVDAAGKPLVVYHGTPNGGFFEFSEATKGQRTGHDGADVGYHFTTDPGYAEAYSEGYKLESIEAYRGMFGEEPAGTKMPPGAATYPVYLAIKNPMVVGASKHINRSMIEQAKAAGHDGIIADMGGAREYVAFKPNQIKSATGNNGEFDPANPDLRASIAGGIAQGIDAATLRELPRMAGNRMKDFRGIGLGALGRRQLVDLYAGDFAEQGKPSLLKRYSDLVQQMDADKNEAGAEADEMADRWGKLKDGDKVADLMHDSTLAQIDPSKDFIAGDNRIEWAALQRRFKALSPEGQKLYQDARDAYMKHWQKVRAEIRNRIERATPDSPRRAALLEKMDATFYEKVKGVYFPLARFGDYVVTVTDQNGDRLSVNFAETMNEAEALRRALLAKFPPAGGHTVSKITKKKEFNPGRDAVSRGFLQELFGVLDQYEGSAELQDDINQLYLSSLPDLSWAKHGIHRKGTPGFSQDARRAFAQNMFHGARYLSKLRYGDRLGDFLMEMQDHVDGKARDADYDSVKAQQVVDEMNKRHELYMNPKGNQLSSTLTSIGFIFYLGLSPASAAVNLSQTPLVTLPMLAAKYGFSKASAALMEAAKLAAANKNDISKALKGDELSAYNEAIGAGVIDVSMAHDLAGIASGDDTKAHGKLRPVMKWASWMFHHGEKFNRQATLLAAYRLARGDGKDHAAAYESAVNEVYASHFDYSSGNRPRIMQGNVARVVLLFKQYAENMIYTLSRNAVLAAKGDKVALRTLSGLLVSHALAAGVLGLPVVGTLLSVASALGGDEDEPWDAKVALRNMLADLIGQKPAEVMMHGVSRLTPWDISGRVGLDKLILPDVYEGLEGARAAEAWMTAALGPVAGIGLSTAKGLASMSEGKYMRGMEEMLPVSIRNPLKAIRYASEGVQDKTGVPVLDDTNALEELGQALGFSPSRSREAMEGKGAVYQAERKLNDRRAALVAQWARAKMVGDDEGAQEVREEIKHFNDKHPTRKITQVNLTQSLRNRNRRIEESENGVYLPKKHGDVRDLGRFAEQD